MHSHDYWNLYFWKGCYYFKLTYILSICSSILQRELVVNADGKRNSTVIMRAWTISIKIACIGKSWALIESIPEFWQFIIRYFEYYIFLRVQFTGWSEKFRPYLEKSYMSLNLTIMDDHFKDTPWVSTSFPLIQNGHHVSQVYSILWLMRFPALPLIKSSKGSLGWCTHLMVIVTCNLWTKPIIVFLTPLHLLQNQNAIKNGWRKTFTQYCLQL